MKPCFTCQILVPDVLLHMDILFLSTAYRSFVEDRQKETCSALVISSVRGVIAAPHNAAPWGIGPVGQKDRIPRPLCSEKSIVELSGVHVHFPNIYPPAALFERLHHVRAR